MLGECLCRRVRLEVPAPPPHINICNCQFCRKGGGAWMRYPASEVTITGPTASYVREDLADAWLVGHFCPTCGSMTHYTDTAEHPSDRIGINLRLFAQADLSGTEVRYLDGFAVAEDAGEFPVTATGHIGDGKAF